MLKLKIACLLALLFCFKIGSAQFEYSPKVQKAQNYILDLEFEKYESLKRSFSINEKGMGNWLDAYKCFIDYKTTSSLKNLDSTIQIIKTNSNDIAKTKNSSAFYHYCLADTYLMIGFLCLDKQEYFKSIQYYMSAKSEFTSYRKRYPEFEYGAKHELIQSTFNNMLAEQLGFASKDKNKQFNEFMLLVNDSISNYDHVIKRELKLLCLMLVDFQPAYSSLNEKQLGITSAYATLGPIESLVTSLRYKKMLKYNDQKKVLAKAYAKHYFDKINVLQFWYGNVLLNERSDSAIFFLERFLFNQQNPTLLNYARYKSSLDCFLKGNKQVSDSLNKLIKTSTQTITNEDKQAKYEIERSQYWQTELVLARVLFDGGNYNEALTVLLDAKDNIAHYLPQEKLEYSYRMARIYHMKKDFSKAHIFYEMVIESNLDDEFYYPAYSAYYLGDLYQELDNPDEAKYYYALCLELNSPIYKLSIHKKAEQALK